MSETILFTDWKRTVFIEAGDGKTWKATCGNCGENANPHEGAHVTIPHEISSSEPPRQGCLEPWLYAASTMPYARKSLQKAWPQFIWIGVVAERGPLDYHLYESWLKHVPENSGKPSSGFTKLLSINLAVFAGVLVIMTVCNTLGWLMGYPGVGRVTGFLLGLTWGLFGTHQALSGKWR